MVTLCSSVPVFNWQWHLRKNPLNSTPAGRLKKLIFLTTRSVKVLSFSYSRHDPHCSKQLLIKDGVREVILQP